MCFVSVVPFSGCDNSNENSDDEILIGDRNPYSRLIMYFEDERHHSLLNDVSVDTVSYTNEGLFTDNGDIFISTVLRPDFVDTKTRVWLYTDEYGKRYLPYMLPGTENKYTTVIISPTIFGDNNAHIIETYWAQRKNDPSRKCEKVIFDGVKLDIETRDFTYSGSDKLQSYVVTIPVKRNRL